MTRKALADNLAHSLTLGAWTRLTISSALTRRLPGALHPYANGIAKDLIRQHPTQYAPTPKVVARSLRGMEQITLIHHYCERYATWPAPDLNPPCMLPIPAFNNLEIPQLPTVGDLADWLMLPVERLDYLSDSTGRFEAHGDMAVNHYHYVLKPKSSGGKRLIEAPKVRLKAIQRVILCGILDKLPTHPDAFGFVKGRNCLMGAARHASEDTVVCFDLKDFFPSIASGRVFGLFRCLGYPHAVAHHLTAFCTTATPPRILDHLAPKDRMLYRAPHLPQGAPTSPALANHAAFNLDRRCAGLARRLDANYTRYADDITFSGDAGIAQSLLTTVPQITRDEGFIPNACKTRVMPQTTRQSVTGTVVNAHLNIDRRTYDHLKAVIHACGKPDDTRLKDRHFRASLLGKIAWVEAVNPAKGQKLRDRLATSAQNRSGSTR